jgi:hypothetical protein
MASTKQEGTQVRKTISFSKRRDQELIDFIKSNDDDFSYNAKQLMLDGLRFRQLVKQSNENSDFPPQSSTLNMEHKIESRNEQKLKSVSKSVNNKEDQWDELMEVETSEADIDEEQLERRLDDF